MLFNSIDFFIFFAVVATQYYGASFFFRWSLTLVGLAFPVVQYGVSPTTVVATAFCTACVVVVTAIRRFHSEILGRKILLTAASLLFYSAWRWPFTSLLLINTLLNYACALGIVNTDHQRRRRFFLTLSMVGNLGVLCFFKYTNFILENIEELLGVSGLTVDIGPLNIILPLGISFYTFQTMSYTIDVYRRQLEARRSILDVALFVSFFPQLVAGPIVRARELMPQLDEKKLFDSGRVKAGLFLMMWGLAKKLLVADALAPIVNQAYANPDLYSGFSLLLAIYCFAFQIYCDFSGYSDIAIGAARVLGFHIPLNFNCPYFAANITTFWRRWHISLSTWLRDYLYIPLGGSRCGRPRIVFNLLVTMILGGLWHGASWNFVIWGTIHGVVLVLHKVYLWKKGSQVVHDTPKPLQRLILSLVNFHLICITWVFFRAETLPKALDVFVRIVNGADGLMVPYLFPAVLIPLLLCLDLIQSRIDVTNRLLRHSRVSRLLIYFGGLLMLALVTADQPADFIYFVF